MNLSEGWKNFGGLEQVAGRRRTLRQREVSFQALAQGHSTR